MVCPFRTFSVIYHSLTHVVSIIGSLAGTSYYGPVGGHGLLSHDLEMLREERKRYLPEKSGVVRGNIEAVPAPDDADNYVVIRKKAEEEKQKPEDGKDN